MNARPSQFCNQSLSIGRRISERVELLDFPEIVREMKGELRCLLRDNIRLRIVARHAAGGRAKIYRGEIKDLIRHLVLDARDAMPAGGALSILTGRVALDAEYIRTHPEVRPATMRCSPSAILATDQVLPRSTRLDAMHPFAKVGASV